MRTDKLKKYLIPNIPYLFILWACLKLGTAYRLAAGADVAHKLMGLGQTIFRALVGYHTRGRITASMPRICTKMAIKSGAWAETGAAGSG